MEHDLSDAREIVRSHGVLANGDRLFEDVANLVVRGIALGRSLESARSNLANATAIQPVLKPGKRGPYRKTPFRA
jgi:hypothetical protein